MAAAAPGHADIWRYNGRAVLDIFPDSLRQRFALRKMSRGATSGSAPVPGPPGHEAGRRRTIGMVAVASVSLRVTMPMVRRSGASGPEATQKAGVAGRPCPEPRPFPWPKPRPEPERLPWSGVPDHRPSVTRRRQWRLRVTASPDQRGRAAGGGTGCDHADRAPAAYLVADTADRIALPVGARLHICAQGAAIPEGRSGTNVNPAPRGGAISPRLRSGRDRLHHYQNV